MQSRMTNGKSGRIKIKCPTEFLLSVLPADIEVAVLFEQDVSDVLAVKQQVVLHVSGSCCCGGVGGLPLLLLFLVISGEAHLELAQRTAGHKALQLLSGTRRRIAETHPNILGHCKSNFLQGYSCHPGQKTFVEIRRDKIQLQRWRKSCDIE